MNIYIANADRPFVEVSETGSAQSSFEVELKDSWSGADVKLKVCLRSDSQATDGLGRDLWQGMTYDSANCGPL